MRNLQIHKNQIEIAELRNIVATFARNIRPSVSQILNVIAKNIANLGMSAADFLRSLEFSRDEDITWE